MELLAGATPGSEAAAGALTAGAGGAAVCADNPKANRTSATTNGYGWRFHGSINLYIGAIEPEL
jgi:hypothetical protein